MAIQLPEPDYYTLAEVAERWEVSEDYLLRIADEDKIKLAIKLPPIPITASLQHADFLAPKTRDDFERLFPGYAEKFRYKIITGKAQIEEYLQRPPGENKWRLLYPDDDVVTLEEHLMEQDWWPLFYIDVCGYGNISTPFLLDRRIESNTIDCVTFSEVTHFVSGEPWPIQGSACQLPPISESGWTFYTEINQVDTSELLIPTSEIHRIEGKREAAKKANTEDVLGTTERETMQAVIAAMTQYISGTAPKYKRGGRPNVDAISGALEKVIPDRTKRGISETIRRALKAGLIRN